jgi:hypothetical protein
MPTYLFGLIDLTDDDRAVVHEVWRTEELNDDEEAEYTMDLYDLPAYICPSNTNRTVIYDDGTEDY